MTEPASDKLIANIEQVIEDAENTHTCSRKTENYAALIARIRQQDAEIERLRVAFGTLRPAAEAHLKHLEETASHYHHAYSAFPGAEGHRIFAEEYEAKAGTIRAVLKGEFRKDHAKEAAGQTDALIAEPAKAEPKTKASPELLEAAKELLDACESDFGGDDIFDGDDEPVGGGINDDGTPNPMAITFGHIRRVKAAIAKSGGAA